MMKKIILPFLLICILLVPLKAQENEETYKRKNFFYIAPADLFFNTLELGFERKLKNFNTIVLLGGFKLSEKDGLMNRIGWNSELQYRINLLYNKEALSKIARNYSTFTYFAPYLQYRYEEIINRIYVDFTPPVHATTTVNSYFGGVGFGCRFTAIENRFCLNIFAGGGLKYSDLYGDKSYSDFWEVGYTGITGKVEFQMGIAF